MSELKITKGSGFSVFPCKSIRENELSSNVGVQNSTGHIVASCGPASNEHSAPNADLIAEAFNVANETNLTPSQLLEQVENCTEENQALLEQRDELLTALKKLTSESEDSFDNVNARKPQSFSIAIHEANYVIDRMEVKS